MPATLEDLSKCKIVTHKMSGWDEDITKCQSFDDLPAAAQDYLAFIEAELDVPISWVGTGPAREEMFLNA